MNAKKQLHKFRTTRTPSRRIRIMTSVSSSKLAIPNNASSFCSTGFQRRYVCFMQGSDDLETGYTISKGNINNKIIIGLPEEEPFFTAERWSKDVFSE